MRTINMNVLQVNTYNTKDIYYININQIVNFKYEEISNHKYIHIITTTMHINRALVVTDVVEAGKIIKETLRQIEYAQKSPIIDINDIQIRLRKEKE